MPSRADISRKDFISSLAKTLATGALTTAGLPAAGQQAAGDRPVALITGTSSGFGRRMAMTFARAGYKTYASMRQVAGRNAGKAAELTAWAAAETAPLQVIELDVTSPTDAGRAVDGIIRDESRLDVLINNAGILLYAPSEIVTREMWELQMLTNVFGPMTLTGLALPHMRYRRSGLIINVSSFVGRTTLPGLGLYAASKFTLEAATEALHYETKPDGVDLALIQPTPFDTDINRNARRYFSDISRPSMERERRWGSEHHRQFLAQLDRNFSGQPTRDPQEVADLALRIAQMPPEQRTLRYPVGDGDTAMLREMNGFTAGIQRRVLNNSGYGHLYRD